MILAREKAGSTALGNGIAMPHCRTGLVKKLVGVVGIDQHGLAFDAVDGEPVYVVFLLLAPLDDRAQHFDVLGQISAIGKDKALRLCLRGCQSPHDLNRFLQDWDRNLGDGVRDIAKP
jgi:PTS system nitrogen regulatory IIA component